MTLQNHQLPDKNLRRLHTKLRERNSVTKFRNITKLRQDVRPLTSRLELVGIRKLEAEQEVGEAIERTEMAELECKLAERELSGLLSEENRHVPYRIYVWSFTSSRASASFHVTCVFFSPSPIHVCFWFFISSRVLARLNVTCVFVVCYWTSTHAYVLLCISLWILACLHFAFSSCSW